MFVCMCCKTNVMKYMRVKVKDHNIQLIQLNINMIIYTEHIFLSRQ